MVDGIGRPKIDATGGGGLEPEIRPRTADPAVFQDEFEHAITEVTKGNVEHASKIAVLQELAKYKDLTGEHLKAIHAALRPNNRITRGLQKTFQPNKAMLFEALDELIGDRSSYSLGSLNELNWGDPANNRLITALVNAGANTIGIYPNKLVQHPQAIDWLQNGKITDYHQKCYLLQHEIYEKNIENIKKIYHLIGYFDNERQFNSEMQPHQLN